MAPATVLRRLADSGADGPEVSVHLAGGQVLGGRPLRVDTDRGQEVVLLAGPRDGQLAYALLANVVAVEVREPERVQDILTEGRLPPPFSGEPVTRLALRREFAPSPELPLRVDWEAVPDSAAGLGNLDRLLRALRTVAGRVRADDLGRQAWASVGAVRVEHRPGAGLSVERVAGGLLVRADLSAALPRDLTGELGRQVDARL